MNSTVPGSVASHRRAWIGSVGASWQGVQKASQVGEVVHKGCWVDRGSEVGLGHRVRVAGWDSWAGWAVG